MECRRAFGLMTIALLGACGKERVRTIATSSPTPSSSTPAASSDWTDFEGIQYRAPAGTNVERRDGVLPGPGGQGGIPGGDRISVTLTKPNGFYVEIVKNARPTSLEGEKYALVAAKAGTNMVDKVTSTGWELTYDMPVTGNGKTATQAHELYADLGGGHFMCSYADVNCPDAAAAEAICRSLRAKPVR